MIRNINGPKVERNDPKQFEMQNGPKVALNYPELTKLNQNGLESKIDLSW